MQREGVGRSRERTSDSQHGNHRSGASEKAKSQSPAILDDSYRQPQKTSNVGMLPSGGGTSVGYEPLANRLDAFPTQSQRLKTYGLIMM